MHGSFHVLNVDADHRLDGRIGIAGAGVLILHPTFSFIALHALSEPLALALVAAAVSRLVVFFATGERRSSGMDCFLLCAASCAKPVYLPICYAACAYAAWGLLGIAGGPAARSPSPRWPPAPSSCSSGPVS